MSNGREIERISRKIGSSNFELKRQRNRFIEEIYYLRHWWQGEASKSFKIEYQKLDAVAQKVVFTISRLEQKLFRLAVNVERADEERRRKAEKRRRAKSPSV